MRVLAFFGHSRARAWFAIRSPQHLEKLRDFFTSVPDAKFAWFHCASLGEYEQTAPVIEAYLNLHPSTPILLTIFSPSGYVPLTTRSQPSWLRPTDFISALPLDSPSRVRQFLGAISYRVSFFASAKYEVWPELLKQLHLASIPSYVFAVHITPNSSLLRQNLTGKFLRTAWSRFDGILTQDSRSVDLLASVGISSIAAGDPRADRVLQIAESSVQSADLLEWKGSRRLVVAGSTWPAEEEALASLVWDSNNCLIIAPHEVHDEHIDSVSALFNCSASRLSNGSHSSPVLVVDSIGLLSSLYALGDLAVVGGGFGVGIHNVLEPAAHGLSIITGPNINRFREASALIETGGMTVSSDPSQLPRIISSQLQDVNFSNLKARGEAVKKWVQAQSGSAVKIAEFLP